MPRAADTNSSPLPVVGPSGLPPPTQPKRSKKRSADEAALLTPPGTIKRERKRRGASSTSSRKRTTESVTSGRASTAASKSRSSRATDSEVEIETELNEAESSGRVFGAPVGVKLDFGRSMKRRRLGELDARLETLLELDGENSDNPFWDGPTKDSNKEDKGKTKTDDETQNDSKHVRLRSPSPPLISFRGKAPVSPPPSNRRKKRTKKKVAVSETITEEPSKEEELEKPIKEVNSEGGSKDETTEKPSEKVDTEELVKEPIVEESLPELPSTPKGKGRSLPVRDSPNNPFLDTEEPSSSVLGAFSEPRTPTIHAEKPTITYVFRGVRAQFANPIYNLPPEVHERASLPPSHPDFSPDPTCPPKLLFPKAAGRSSRRSASPTPCTPSRTRTGKQGAVGSKNIAIPPALPHSDNEHQWDSDDEPLHVTPPKRLLTRSLS